MALEYCRSGLFLLPIVGSEALVMKMLARLVITMDEIVGSTACVRTSFYQ
jgi:hypothetical protein